MRTQHIMRMPKKTLPRTGTVNTVLRTKSDAAIEAIYNAEAWGYDYHPEPDEINNGLESLHEFDPKKPF